MNYLFYDYETSGRNEKFDQIFQFAGIRTDDKFRQIGEPLEYFCKLRADVLPSPWAIKVNQIDISELNSKGLSEFEFAKKVSAALLGDGDQCIVGYKSKTFDNNFTRFLLYRNFFEPYAWSYLNGNSCLDIFDVVCLGYSFERLTDIQVNDGSGDDSLKLENLAKWNGLNHDHAHEAVSDVLATIHLARLVNEKCPRLFEYVLRLRNVAEARSIFFTKNKFFHSSTTNGYERRFLSLHTGLCDHPTFPRYVVGWNLENDPAEILDLSAEEIRNEMYAKKQYRSINVGFDDFKLNGSPMIVPFFEAQKNRVADYEACAKNLEAVQKNEDSLVSLATKIFDSEIPEEDPDADLYVGDYFGEMRADEKLCRAVRVDPMTVDDSEFKSPRLRRMFRRMKARNFFNRLTDVEQEQYERFCAEKSLCSEDKNWQTKSVFDQELVEVLADVNLSERQRHCLTVLRQHVENM